MGATSRPARPRLPGHSACRPLGLERSIWRTGDGCQGESPGGRIDGSGPRHTRRRLPAAERARVRVRRWSPAYAAIRPVAGNVVPGTPAGGLWAGGGLTPRCVRIFPVCRARHRQVDHLALLDETYGRIPSRSKMALDFREWLFVLVMSCLFINALPVSSFFKHSSQPYPQQ